MTELSVDSHYKIAEYVTWFFCTNITATDVREILEAKTIGWPDGVVALVQMQADNYNLTTNIKGTDD